jgi:hypothetical protein
VTLLDRRFVICPSCGRERRTQSPDPRHVRCRDSVAPDHIKIGIRRWAQRTWDAWTPNERAEFAGAMDSIGDVLAGAGEGEPARKRFRSGRL